mgnify:CR=1 FL=1
MTMKLSQLQAEATQLLRKAGCRADGRRKGEVCWKQQTFESHLIRVPFGGQSKPLVKGK